MKLPYLQSLSAQPFFQLMQLDWINNFSPFLLLAVAGLFTTAPDLTQITQNPMAVFSSVSFIVLLVLSLPVMVWSIALMYNGFKVSCGVQGSKLMLAFILGLFTAEIVSKLAYIGCYN